MTVIADLDTAETIAWWVSIGVGLVVAVVVLILLEALRRTVKAVDDGVTAVWSAGKHLAQNTQTTHLLDTTRARGLELLEELEHHRGPAEGS